MMNDLTITLTKEGRFPSTIIFTEDFSKRLPYGIGSITKPRQKNPVSMGQHTTLETGMFSLGQKLWAAEKSGWVIKNKDEVYQAMFDRMLAKRVIMDKYWELITNMRDGKNAEDVLGLGPNVHGLSISAQ